MWLLLIVLLNTEPGLGKVTVLNTYATPDGCQQERNRIGYAMAESYPHEHTFDIVCTLRRGVLVV